MNPRLAALAALCRDVAIPASVLAWIAAFGSAGIDNTGAAPLVDRLTPSLTADAKFAELPPVGAADVETASRSVTEAPAADATAASPEPVAKMSVATRETDEANRAVGSTEVLDECFVVDTCIDRYLWALYQRTPKEDAIKTQEQRFRHSPRRAFLAKRKCDC